MAGKRVNQTAELNKILIDNFVSLQRAMTNLVVKFDSLSDNISKLLNLFEISAKSFIEKHSSIEKPVDVEKDKEFLDKLNKLLDQNKTIAKGLTLMEEKIRERVYGNKPEPSLTIPTIQPRPIFQRPQPMQPSIQPMQPIQESEDKIPISGEREPKKFPRY